VSADMAHGVHPNFMDKHEEHHRPEMQKGLVIKHNANQRYATSGVTAFLFKEVGKIHNLPTQVVAIYTVCPIHFAYPILNFLTNKLAFSPYFGN
jgi:aspartyl aminopeptidase